VIFSEWFVFDNWEENHIERKAQIEARKQRVRDRKEQGWSTRQIAEEEGVSHMQVVRDLETDAGVTCVTPASADPSRHEQESDKEVNASDNGLTAPEAVQGRDGKQYLPAAEIEQRRQRVQEARKEGLSTRQIAAQEGVDHRYITSPRIQSSSLRHSAQRIQSVAG
jgi:transposase